MKALEKSKRGLILLTDSKNNPYNIAKVLVDSGYQNTKIIVGERLSYSDEKITRFYAKDYKSYQRGLSNECGYFRKGEPMGHIKDKDFIRRGSSYD